MYQRNEHRRENLTNFFEQYVENEQTRVNMPHAANGVLTPMLLLQGKRYCDTPQEETRESHPKEEEVEEEGAEEGAEEDEEQVEEDEEPVEIERSEAETEWDDMFQIMDQFHVEADFCAPVGQPHRLRIVYGFTDGILGLNFA